VEDDLNALIGQQKKKKHPLARQTEADHG
jgi:hypothetical protein